MVRRAWMTMAAMLALVACDDSSSESDAGMDGAVEMDGGAQVETIALEGLDGPVEVIVDDRGIPHIYATTLHDLMMAEGYLMARDRFVQMEFIRRSVTGRLGEVLGAFSPDVIDSDRDSRFLGFARVGREIYESLPEGDRTRLVAEAFVAGVNAYIDGVVRAPGYQPPRGLEAFNPIRVSEAFGHWEPADIFALARYQSWNLSYDADADIRRTRALRGVEAAFPPTSTPEAEQTPEEARAGIFADFFSERPARAVYTRDGFNTPTATSLVPNQRPAGPLPTPRSLDALRGAERFFSRIGENPLLRRDPHVGSNSWVVHGELTASGNPILANDPHLSLISPGVWWYVHLNTERMGGEDAIDAQGVAFAGLPGIVLGFNRDLAWSATTTGYDVTDVYEETVTFRNDGTEEDPEWVPVSVRFEGEDVPLTTIVEPIGLGNGTIDDFVIYVVPHHGPIIPDSIVPPEPGETIGTALSVRYTGHVPTNELSFFTDLITARTVDEALAAQRTFRVGAQNFSFISRDGDIAWSTEARIPRRQPNACTFSIDENGIVSGISPLFVLPGEGGYEWTSDLEPEVIPHDRNPARGYIATANQDNVGVTDDGNPCNDEHYIGGDFAVGYRMHRIVERLDALAAGGSITTDDMIALQAETKSSLGETLRDPIVASIDRALGDGPHPEALEALLTEIGEEGRAELMAVREILTAWTLETPHGVGASDSAVVTDSVATTVFNATITRLIRLAFADESARIGVTPGDSQLARLLEWSMADAAAQQALPLYTFRQDYAGIEGYADTVLWDDVDTPEIETRDERVVRAILMAVEWLEEELGADKNEWRWGRLHAVRFAQVVPAIVDPGIVSIPPVDSTEFPLGFPRNGDYGAVDVGNFSLMDGTNFTHRSGASQRLVVEMTPDGPRAYNALPGGQSEDPDSPHHADEAEYWRRNQQPPLYFERADVEANAEARFELTPN